MSEIQRCRDRLRKASSLLVLTGAGISAESGVPTFRGGGGAAVWRGMPFEVLSSARMVEEDLPLVWEWFDYRREKVLACEPNAGHIAVAEAELSGRFASLTVITQNIDGLHQRAGSRKVVEYHGSIHTARCLDCGELRDIASVDVAERPPGCLKCAGPMRPNVVLFGEMIPLDAIATARDAATGCDVCLVVGTSAVVYPANEIPLAARRNGAFVVEVNPEETPLTASCDVSLRGNAAAILPELFRE